MLPCCHKVSGIIGQETPNHMIPIIYITTILYDSCLHAKQIDNSVYHILQVAVQQYIKIQLWCLAITTTVLNKVAIICCFMQKCMYHSKSIT